MTMPLKHGMVIFFFAEQLYSRTILDHEVPEADYYKKKNLVIDKQNTVSS